MIFNNAGAFCYEISEIRAAFLAAASDAVFCHREAMLGLGR